MNDYALNEYQLRKRSMIADNLTKMSDEYLAHKLIHLNQ